MRSFSDQYTGDKHHDRFLHRIARATDSVVAILSSTTDLGVKAAASSGTTAKPHVRVRIPAESVV